MDQELLMKQIVEQVMAAMKNGTPASAPAAASSCGSKVTAANYPLAESMADQIKTPTGKDFTSLSYEKVINGELSADDMRIAPETLEMQAQVAESVHREAFASNLRRAAELIAVPDDRLLEDLQCPASLPLHQAGAAGHRRRAGRQVRRQDRRFPGAGGCRGL